MMWIAKLAPDLKKSHFEHIRMSPWLAGEGRVTGRMDGPRRWIDDRIDR